MTSAPTPSPSVSTPQPARTKSRWLDRISRRLLLRTLCGLEVGCLRVVDGDQTDEMGDSSSQLSATLTVHHPRFYRRTVRGGSLGAADSFLEGDWSCDDLTSLMRIFGRNMSLSYGMDRGIARVLTVPARLAHRLRPNTRAGARKNIHDHYDLSNEFFALFLDERMMYSSAYFEDESVTLDEAATAKLERICRKLQLTPSDHVVEIGTGWGGFAEYAVRNFGCRVTTTTISQEQYHHARERIAAAGLSDRVDVRRDDYRDLTGQYSKLVSIEMIEAVGHKNLGVFFGQCGRLLRDDGLMLLQGITMAEQRYDYYLKAVDFIQQHVFPGACLPSQMAMSSAVAKHTDMRVAHVEDLSAHYAETLRRWRTRFFAELDAVRQLGFDDRFIRLWDYYLSYCEAGFAERLTGLVQTVFAKPLYRGDAVRSAASTEGAEACLPDC